MSPPSTPRALASVRGAAPTLDEPCASAASTSMRARRRQVVRRAAPALALTPGAERHGSDRAHHRERARVPDLLLALGCAPARRVEVHEVERRRGGALQGGQDVAPTAATAMTSARADARADGRDGDRRHARDAAGGTAAAAAAEERPLFPDPKPERDALLEATDGSSAEASSSAASSTEADASSKSGQASRAKARGRRPSTPWRTCSARWASAAMAAAAAARGGPLARGDGATDSAVAVRRSGVQDAVARGCSRRAAAAARAAAGGGDHGVGRRRLHRRTRCSPAAASSSVAPAAQERAPALFGDEIRSSRASRARAHARHRGSTTRRSSAIAAGGTLVEGPSPRAAVAPPRAPPRGRRRRWHQPDPRPRRRAPIATAGCIHACNARLAAVCRASHASCAAV